jgi:hypothetical protein
MTALLLKSSGPVADQYRVLAGDRVVGHVRQSESARWTVAYGETRARTRTHGSGQLARMRCRRSPRAGIGNE